jgi:hypothetical protein
MSERTEADKLARRLLDETGVDPDDELRMLSRQLLRRGEVVDRLQNHLGEIQDGTRDLINANRDMILEIHQEGFRLIKNQLSQISGNADRVRLIEKIFHAIDSFHPMHGESWVGWPEGSKL